MADWYDDIADAMKALALATLTEITATNFYTVVQSLRQNIVSEALKSTLGDSNRVSPPYLIQQIGTDVVPSDLGPDARYYRLPTRFYYVIDKTPSASKTSFDPPAYCRSRLELLRVALQTQGSLSVCQWTGEDGEIDSSEDVAFANEKLTLFAAELTFETGFLTRLS